MIHRFRVQNFNSLIDVTVDLSPVTVLVGKSGTGKSNFVESIRVLRNILSSKQKAKFMPGTWPQLRPATMPESPTRFEIEFSLAGIEERFGYELALTKEGLEQPPLEERLVLGKTCLFHQSGKDNQPEWIVEPQVLPLPPAGQIALGAIPSISEIVIAFTALTSGIGCYAFAEQVLCGGMPNKPKPGLDDRATNYLAALKDMVSNLQDLTIRKSIIASLRHLNPTVSSVELDNIEEPTHVVVGHKLDGKTVSLRLSQESGGFRRFYAHLLALYQRPPKQTLIFEHPEDGIHPGALSLLAEEFKAAPEQGRGQVILTTHSPKLLDQFDADQIRVVELDGLQTRIGPVSMEQKEAIQEKLLDPGELLTVDPARIQMEATGA